MMVCVLLSLTTGITNVSAISSDDKNITKGRIVENNEVEAISSIKGEDKKLNVQTVPEIIGEKIATERKQVERLYDKEDSLYNVVFENIDGTETLYMFDYPVKYVAETGEIKDVTLDIKEDEKKEGAFVSAEHNIQTYFPHKLSEGIKLEDSKVSITLQPIISSRYIKNDTEMQNANLINSKTVEYCLDERTSFEYSLTYTGFKEDIVVNEYTGQTEYEFILLTEGLELKQVDGSYYLVDQNDNVQATIGDIIIFTADEKNNTFGQLTYETIRETEEYKLIIHVDKEYLEDEETTYPIRIDPTIEINYDNNGTNGIQDVTLNSAKGSSGTSGSLFVGKRATYGISRTLMKFPELDLSMINSSDCILDANVEIRDIMCEADALTVYCYVFKGNEWDESTANWSNVSPDSYSTCLSSNSISYSNGVSKTTKHRYSFDITKAVKGWKNGNYSKSKGIIFKASSSVENGSTNISKTFASYNRSSNKPTVTITYAVETVGIKNDTKYYIMNYASRRFLSLETTADTNVSNVFTREGSSTTLSQWKTELQSDGRYQLISVYSPTAKSLDVTGGNVDIYTDTGGECLKFTIERINSGSYAGLYYIKQGSLYVTQISDYNVKVSSSPSTAAIWSFMAVEKGDADIFSFKYTYTNDENETRTFNTSQQDATFETAMEKWGYDSYIECNASAALAYICLCDRDDVFIFNGHGTAGALAFYDEDGEDFGTFAVDTYLIPNSQNRYISECEANELSSLRCVLYLGCSTGVDYSDLFDTYNLVTATYNKGAHFVLGTTEIVYTDDSDNFLKGFLSGVSENKNLAECIQRGIDKAGTSVASDTGRYPIVYIGDTIQYLSY